MKEEIKRRRDRARFEKYGGMELVREFILKLPEKERYAKGFLVNDVAMQIAKEKIKRKSKQRYFLAKIVLRQAVGNGYLNFQNGKYTLTRKARKLRENRNE
ncbi:MAG: hypothetical protein ABGX27_08765 [Desulfurobacteriaceae bacterium]